MVDERPHHNQRTEHLPQPESACRDSRHHAPPPLFLADAVTEIMEPHQPANAKREPTDEEVHQAVVHRLLAVAWAGDGIERLGRSGHDHDVVDAKGDQTKQNELRQRTVRGQPVGIRTHLLHRWRRHGCSLHGRRRVSHMSLPFSHCSCSDRPDTHRLRIREP
ncbi:hypothetical protein BIFLAC_01766 [Bifidobacterium animalis subsp. lactis HN019]|nr:hypothetical protein BIFLAC_01766 [Bifidobacterium animalis subsp. lactis HN019]